MSPWMFSKPRGPPVFDTDVDPIVDVSKDVVDVSFVGIDDFARSAALPAVNAPAARWSVGRRNLSVCVYVCTCVRTSDVLRDACLRTDTWPMCFCMRCLAIQ